MSIKSIENPNLTKDVILARGTNSTQVKPWMGRIQVQLDEELGKAPARSPQTPLVVRPEGRRELEKVHIPVLALGGGWEKRTHEGRFRLLRNPTNRMGGSIFTEPRLILNTTRLTRDWCRHFSLDRHPFPQVDHITNGRGQKEQADSEQNRARHPCWEQWPAITHRCHLYQKGAQILECAWGTGLRLSLQHTRIHKVRALTAVHCDPNV